MCHQAAVYGFACVEFNDFLMRLCSAQPQYEANVWKAHICGERCPKFEVYVKFFCFHCAMTEDGAYGWSEWYGFLHNRHQFSLFYYELRPKRAKEILLCDERRCKCNAALQGIAPVALPLPAQLCKCVKICA